MGSSSSKKFDTAPLVVIIGCGYGGRQLAAKLETHCNVLILEPRDAFHHTIGAIRACADKDFAPKTLIPYTNAFKRAKIVKARASKITKDAVYVEGSEDPIPFDYLVIATGASYDVAGMYVAADAKDRMLDEPTATNAKIEAAQNIVLVGSGPVGVEFSGEILRKYPDKSVTLVSRAAHVLKSKHFKDDLGIEFEKRVEMRKGSLKFKIVAGQSVDPAEQKEGSGFVTTDKGEKIEADAVFYCIGSRSGKSNEQLFEGIKESVDAATSRLKVDKVLRVEGQSNIFAIGDVALIDQTATAITAIANADHLNAVILALVAGKTPPDYVVGAEMIIAPFGEITGTSVLFGKYLTGRMGWLGEFLAKKAKGGDVLSANFWKELKADINNPPEYKTGDLASDEVQALLQQCRERRQDK